MPTMERDVEKYWFEQVWCMMAHSGNPITRIKWEKNKYMVLETEPTGKW